jgi:hypothetical protein
MLCAELDGKHDGPAICLVEGVGTDVAEVSGRRGLRTDVIA